MRNVLRGIRVLDFGSFIAAPYCAALLAEFGADVIRVEKVSGGEDRWYTPVGAKDSGALLAITGRNKKGLTLNPGLDRAKPVLRKLIASADIVIANRTAAGLSALNLDYESLRQIRDDIILVSMSAYGYEGPYAEKIGYDNVAQSLSGAAFMSGENGCARKSAVPYCDYGTAALSAFAAVTAILHRRESGEGQWIRTSLLGTGIAFNNLLLLEEQQLHLGRQGLGNSTPGAGPSGIFEAKDGPIFIQVLGDPIFRRWTTLLEVDHLVDDPRFRSDQARGDNSVQLNKLMQEWCSGKSRALIRTELSAARIPCEEVLSPAEVLDHPQVREGGFLESIPMQGFNKDLALSQCPIDIYGERRSPTKMAPKLSEDTDELLGELGFSDPEIAALRSAGVV